MFPRPRTVRVNRHDRKLSFPPAQLQDAIVGHAAPHVLQFRSQREHPSRVHGRQVGHAKGGLVRAKVLFGSSHEPIRIKTARPADNEEREDAEEQRPIHVNPPLVSLVLNLKRGEATCGMENCQRPEAEEGGKLKDRWPLAAQDWFPSRQSRQDERTDSPALSWFPGPSLAESWFQYYKQYQTGAKCANRSGLPWQFRAVMCDPTF